LSQSVQHNTTAEPKQTEVPASEQLPGFRHQYDEKTLFSYLECIVENLPATVRQRGINRNWNKYKFVLTQISRFAELLPQPGGRYLDLGSGAGIVPLVMAKAGLRVSVVDTWFEYADEFNNLMGRFTDFVERFDKYGIDWQKHDITQTPLPFSPQSFELVTLFDVLEHLPRPANIIREIYRVLRPGGLFFLTVPNVANLRNRVRLLLGRSPHPDPIEDWFAADFFGHYREMTRTELIRGFSKQGFSILEAKYTSACHWNTRLPSGQWAREYQMNSIRQVVKLVYLMVTLAVPSFRYELLVAVRKPPLSM
jgi:SAM-dependent methyltransferase